MDGHLNLLQFPRLSMAEPLKSLDLRGEWAGGKRVGERKFGCQWLISFDCGMLFIRNCWSRRNLSLPGFSHFMGGSQGVFPNS